PDRVKAGEDVLAVSLAPPAELLATPTFRSFIRFVGNRPFAAGPALWQQLEGLAADDHVWITRIDEVQIALTALRPMVEGRRVLSMGPLEGNQEWHIGTLRPARIDTIEAYHPNVLKCQVLKTAFPDLPLHIIEANVMEVEIDSSYDFVMCLGLLYHLQDPHLLLDKIRASNPHRLFLTTQLATPHDHPSSAFRQLAEEAEVTVNGKWYRGRLFPDERTSPHEYKTGVDQRASFWFYPDALRQLVADLGFREDIWSVMDLGERGCVAYSILVNKERDRKLKRQWI
ncbi:MAG: hypothetical protein R3301_19610, partial [Saprospiraceae bacterium]|nr:hypothetical protein [Saprospiraceae bacterium]